MSYLLHCLPFCVLVASFQMAQWPNHPYYPPPENYPTYPTAQPQQHHYATSLHSPATYPQEQQQAGNYFPDQQLSRLEAQHQPAGNHHHAGHATPYLQFQAPYPPPPVYVGRPVVGPQYCVGYAVDLVIVRKFWTLKDDFEVTDVNKNVLFKAKGKLLTLRDNRLLSDASGKPLITLRQKILTAHSRWQVYRGDSSEDRDLVFTAETSSMVQFKTKLNVYLPHNTSEDVCDYWVKGSFTNDSCVVYVGDSQTNIAAQMRTKDSIQSVFLGKDKFMVTVSPNVDYAFVVGLILILDAVTYVTDIIKTAVTSTV